MHANSLLTYGLNWLSRVSVNISALLIHLPECNTSQITISLDLSSFGRLRAFSDLFNSSAKHFYLSSWTVMTTHNVLVIDDNVIGNNTRYSLTFARRRSEQTYQRSCHVCITIGQFHKHELFMYRLSRQWNHSEQKRVTVQKQLRQMLRGWIFFILSNFG